MSDALDLLAGEYVLGTLDAEERRTFAARLSHDDGARAAVAAWERRLASLATAGDRVSPSAASWSRIAAALRLDAVPSRGRDADTAALLVSRRRWRMATAASSALATAAVAFSLVVGLGPLLERHGAGRPGGQILIAAVNRGGDKPALMIRVDLATRRVLVFPVAATAPPGRSLELWAVDAPAPPRSLGLVRRTRAELPLPAGTGADTTFAVSVEPEGGSKTGAPTGPVIYSGQLVEE